MAKYAVFSKEGYFYKLAKDESARDHHLQFLDAGIAKEINDTQWNDTHDAMKNLHLDVASDTVSTSDNVNYNTNDEGESDADRDARWLANFERELETQKGMVSAYLNGQSDTEWEAYYANLESINPQDVSFPIDSFARWFKSQPGFSQLSIKELP